MLPPLAPGPGAQHPGGASEPTCAWGFAVESRGAGLTGPFGLLGLECSILAGLWLAGSLGTVEAGWAPER